jgi:SAM-dependent methyltransferase
LPTGGTCIYFQNNESVLTLDKINTIIIDPKLPSFSRYRSIFKKKHYSLSRELQYEILKSIQLKGRVLDFGGGENASYRKLICCESYESVNIDTAINPTWVTKINEELPCSSNIYDTVISFNTLEHVYDAKFVIKEISRILKKEGEFICSVPFLHVIHAHPNDYFRPTPNWWVETLANEGFREVKIIPLIWGPFSTGVVCSGIPGPFKHFRLHIALLMDILYGKLHFPGMETQYSGSVGRDVQKHALSFFVHAVKG